MLIQHVNRKGDTYFLHQGKTKTGKPKWFFSRKEDGAFAEAIPAGYEVYENPNGQVYLRVMVPSKVTKTEIAAVEQGVRDLAQLRHFIVEAKSDCIVIFLPNYDERDIDRAAIEFRVDREQMTAQKAQSATYSPMMRFIVLDEEKRRFAAERWCFLGSIDDWFPLARSGDLAAMVEEYTPHLGKESFFELC